MELYPDTPVGHPEPVDYPPFPWRMDLGDSLVASLHLVDAARAKALVSPGFELVSVAPGKTLGGVYFATYGPGSDLEYNELIVISALVRRGLKLYPWVSHIWVDNPASVRGGRALLGVPKDLGRFEVEVLADGLAVAIASETAPVARLRLTRGPLLPIPLYAASTSANRDLRDPSGRTVVTFGSAFRGKLGLGRTEVTLDPAGPLAELGFGPAFTSLWGRAVTGVLGGIPGRETRTIAVG